MKKFSIPKCHSLTTLAMVVIFVVIIVYSYFKTTDILTGPEITVISPTSGSTYAEELATIKGRAERIAKIYLNDRQIFTDDEGRFTESLLLFPGYNILTLKATDAFGRKVSKQIELIYQG
ncbi:MAG: hypothetical protein AAB821_02700 [Patescibacteria group bacterium]